MIDNKTDGELLVALGTDGERWVEAFYYHPEPDPSWCDECGEAVAAVPTEDGAQCPATDHDLSTNKPLVCARGEGHDGKHGWVLAAAPAVPVLPAEPTDAMVEAFMMAYAEVVRYTVPSGGEAWVRVGLRAALAAGDPR